MRVITGKPKSLKTEGLFRYDSMKYHEGQPLTPLEEDHVMAVFEDGSKVRISYYPDGTLELTALPADGEPMAAVAILPSSSNVVKVQTFS